MKITVTKFKTLQIENYQPIKFGYELEQELPVTDSLYADADKMKEAMEIQIDKWIEEETTRVLEAKKIKDNHGMLPTATDGIPF
jgi:hypothetical protein